MKSSSLVGILHQFYVTCVCFFRVVVHGALAKEVIGQNPILSYKLNPFLRDVTTLVKALNEQLNTSSENLLKTVRELYPSILEMILRTANDEEKVGI